MVEGVPPLFFVSPLRSSLWKEDLPSGGAVSRVGPCCVRAIHRPAFHFSACFGREGPHFYLLRDAVR